MSGHRTPYTVIGIDRGHARDYESNLLAASWIEHCLADSPEHAGALASQARAEGGEDESDQEILAIFKGHLVTAAPDTPDAPTDNTPPQKRRFRVYLERRYYSTGSVVVEADDRDDAENIVEAKLSTGEMQTSDIGWGVPQYEEGSWEMLHGEAHEDDEEGGDA